MPHLLEPLPAPAELFDYRSGMDGAVPTWVPYNQGDVFDGVSVPGLDYSDRDPRLAMLFMHPCTMRTGSGRLEAHLTVVRVRWRSNKTLVGSPYFDSPKLLPLVDLFGDGRTFEGSLMEMGVVASQELPRASRVAVLSAHGRLIVLQRLIYHLTRFAPPIDRLDEATRAVQMEVELESDWTESVDRNLSGLTLEQVDRVESEFDTFLGQAAEDASDDADTVRSRLASSDDGVRAETIAYVRRMIDAGLPGKCLEPPVSSTVAGDE